MHDNTCAKGEYLLGINVVLLNHDDDDDDDHPYSFKLYHVLTSLLCMTMTEHKVNDTPMKMGLFQTIMTIATTLTHCIAFIYSHQYYA